MYVMAAELLRITIRNMPASLWQRVRVLAVERGVAIHLIVVEALLCYFELVKSGKEWTRETEEKK